MPKGGFTMVYLIFFLVSFLASMAGAICGMGGGVIMKPALDTLGILSVPAICFLSGCTVLAMSASNLIKGRICGLSKVKMSTVFPLAAGASFGGIYGKILFNMILARCKDPGRAGALQAGILAVSCLGILIYTFNKTKIHTHRITNVPFCVLIGLLLGFISSFLGIGGGPVNLIVLSFFFSMNTGEAARNSIFIIFFSQAANLLYTLLSGTVPSVSPLFLLIMICAGTAGGTAGSMISRRISEKAVDRLFAGLIIVIIIMDLYNIIKFIS